MELLGIKLDKKRIFNEHINNLSCNISYEAYALPRIRKYLTQEQANIYVMYSLIASLVISQLFGRFKRRINI